MTKPCAVIDCMNTADPRWYARDINNQSVMICDGHDPHPLPEQVNPRIPTMAETMDRAAPVLERLALSERMHTLAANLRIAAGLELAYERGCEYTRTLLYGPGNKTRRLIHAERNAWHPGCGRAVPGWEGK